MLIVVASQYLLVFSIAEKPIHLGAKSTMTTALSKQDLQKLEDAMKVLKPSGAQPAAAYAFNAQNVQTEFCSVWPQAEPILKILAGAVGWIPGVGPGASTIINALIAAGDGVASTVCPRPVIPTN